jgi:signal transduction histidine kinase
MPAMPETPACPLPGATNLWRMFLSTELVSLAVAALLTLMGGNGWINLTYSLLIGNLSSLFINTGRLWVARWLWRSGRADAASASNGWPGWPWVIALVLLGGLLGYTLGSVLAGWLTGYAGHVPTGNSWRGWLAIFIISITASLGVTWYFYSRATLAASEASAQAAARTAAQTQLKLLESQLEPHMLFNTLANLRALIGVDPERAQDMLDRLIDFLRATLSASRAPLHPLQAEFDRVADYLALMQIRMGPRLAVNLRLPPELASQPVPPLLLQPLVENAIKHGLEPLRRGGQIQLSAHTEAGALVLQVADNGQGLHAAASQLSAAAQQPTSHSTSHGDSRSANLSSGFGTTQVRERLATLYGERASLQLSPAEGGGTCARITLPLQAGA